MVFCSENGAKAGADLALLKLCLEAAEEKKELPEFLPPACEKLAQNGEAAGFACLCKIHRLRGHNDIALANCRKAIAADPLYQLSYLEAAKTFSAAGRTDKALEYLNTAVGISSENYKAHYLLGEARERTGNYDGAASSYEKALKTLKPDSSPANLKKAGLIKKKLSGLKNRKRSALAREKKNKAARCRSEYSSLAGPGDVGKKYRKASECLSYSPSDPELAAELAGLALDLGKYEESEAGYKKALPGLKNREKKLEAAHNLAKACLRLNKTPEAEKALAMAYAAGDREPGYLKTYAEILEDSRNYDKALEVRTYLNGIKPERESLEIIETLKDKKMTSQEILEDLQRRGAVNSGKKALEPQDKTLFLAIRLAERKGALEQVRNKYQGYANLYVEVLEGKEFGRKLTLQGYKFYLRDLSQAAVRFFEKKAIRLTEVFKLRTLYGEPIFTPKGELTDEGIQAYFKALNGEKSWLMTYEEAIAGRSREAEEEAESVNEAVKGLLMAGYMEMSEGEYDWLMLATDCPDYVLKASPCNIKTVKSRERLRYFICNQEGLCTGTAIKLSLYISKYRDGNTDIPKEKRATAFFGAGGGPARKFCYKNRIWNGEE